MRHEKEPAAELVTDLDESDAKGEMKNPRSSKHEPDIERVKLGKVESTKVAAWLNQLDSASKGFLQLSKSDLVNYLIRERRDELNPKEMALIRANHYDPIRHLNWITPRLKEAISSGDADQIARLQDEIRSIELSVISKATGSGDGALAPARSNKPKRLRKKAIGLSPPEPNPNPADGIADVKEAIEKN